MKRILLLASLLLPSIEAKAYFLLRIPVVELNKIHALSPFSDMQEYCDTAPNGAKVNCMTIGIRPEADYGQKFVIIMPESSAVSLLKSKFNPYEGMPDPIAVVAVPDSEYPRIMGKANGQLPYPAGAAVSSSDPEIGRKMLYCASSAFACGMIGLRAASITNLVTAGSFLKVCSAAPQALCMQFRDAWRKEQAALKKHQDWNVQHGIIRLSPFEVWYGEVVYPFLMGEAAGGGGGSEGGAPPGHGGVSEGGVLTEQCYDSVVTVGGGPLGETIEYPETTCYYN